MKALYRDGWPDYTEAELSRFSRRGRALLSRHLGIPYKPRKRIHVRGGVTKARYSIVTDAGWQHACHVRLPKQLGIGRFRFGPPLLRGMFVCVNHGCGGPHLSGVVLEDLYLSIYLMIKHDEERFLLIIRQVFFEPEVQSLLTFVRRKNSATGVIHERQYR